MNMIEEINIKKGLLQWGETCIKEDAYPCLLIALQPIRNGYNFKIEKGGAYTVDQLKVLLRSIIEHLPGDDSGRGTIPDLSIIEG